MAFLTRQELLDSYADNSTQDIVAGTHRDFVESTMVYGGLTSAGYTDTVTTTPVRLEFDTAVYGYGMTAGPPGGPYDSLGNFQMGHYKMTLTVDAQLAVNNTYAFGLYDGNTLIGSAVEWDAKTAGDRVLLNFIKPYAVDTDVTDLSVRVSANANSATTYNSLSWIMERLGSD